MSSVCCIIVATGAFRGSDDDEEMNASPSNENVMFKEKKDYSHMGFTYGDRSPVETTTEL